MERAVQTVEGQIRVMKLALEGRSGKMVEAEASVVTFMAEYASDLINRLETGLSLIPISEPTRPD